MKQRVYLDYAATTPLDARVLEKMLPHLREPSGNPSSVHTLGRRARATVESCRERIADHLGCEPAEIVFTSGGTESDNLALHGLRPADKPGLLTSTAEHEAILRPAERLQSQGVPVAFVSPGADGRVGPKAVEEGLAPAAGLVSIMHANNETGARSPVSGIAERCRARGVLVHTDAVQTAGILPLQVNDLGVDALSLTAHKLYGPRGVGVLYVRSGCDLVPLVEGGAQERRRRGGTENVAGIVGLAAAMDLAAEESSGRWAHLVDLRSYLFAALDEALPVPFVLNTPRSVEASVPHIVNIAFPPVDGQPLDGEMLLLNLDLEGVCVSAGSACTSGALQPSHVLTAMGLPRETASAAVRFSFGKETTRQEIDFTVERLAAILKRMAQVPGVSTLVRPT